MPIEKDRFPAVDKIARAYGNGWFTTRELELEGLGDKFLCATLYEEGYLVREPVQELPELSVFRPEMFRYKLRKQRKAANGKSQNLPGGTD